MLILASNFALRGLRGSCLVYFRAPLSHSLAHLPSHAPAHAPPLSTSIHAGHCWTGLFLLFFLCRRHATLPRPRGGGLRRGEKTPPPLQGGRSRGRRNVLNHAVRGHPLCTLAQGHDLRLAGTCGGVEGMGLTIKGFTYYSSTIIGVLRKRVVRGGTHDCSCFEDSVEYYLAMAWSDSYFTFGDPSLLSITNIGLYILPSSFHTQLTFGTIAPFRELFTTKNDAIRSLVLTYLPLSTISGLIGGVVFGAKLPESLVREHEREHERDDHENRAQQFPVRTRLLM